MDPRAAKMLDNITGAVMGGMGVWLEFRHDAADGAVASVEWGLVLAGFDWQPSLLGRN